MKQYLVKNIGDKSIEIDGKLSNSVWQKANLLTDFTYPWENKKVPMTEFRAFYNSEKFFFSFNVKENDIVLLDKIKDKLDIINESRVEIFFSLDKDLKVYYCTEIDAKGRILDNSASLYREFDFLFSFKEIKTMASITKNGYIVEGYIPLKILNNLGFKTEKGSEIFAGIFRANFMYEGNNKISQHWISWVNPKVKQPDFHVPSAFGKLKFM